MTSLTPRQRVQLALDHQEPDRVPLDFATGGNSSPVPEMYARLLAYCGLDAPVRLIPHIMRLAEVDERVLQFLEIDTRSVPMHPSSRGRRPCSEAGAFYDEWGVKWKEIDVGGVVYRELAESPLADATLDDLGKYPWFPDPLDMLRFEGVREAALSLQQETSYALVGTPGFNGVWERAWYLAGFQRMLEGLAGEGSEREFVHALLRKITDLCKLALGRYLDAAGPYLQIVKLGDDLGTQNGPQMSPKTYREMIKPYHQELFSFVKARTPGRVFLHTCGSVYKLLPDLIDAGVDILNPVQVSARDMQTDRLKREFGDRLSFMGAIDTQHVLPFGSPDDVRREVEQRIADLAPGGGYIVAPVHNVQADVPPENLVTLYQYARQVGDYPLQT
jgi:uroporphyrinogen decarboxylase